MRKNGNVIPDRWRLVIGIRAATFWINVVAEFGSGQALERESGIRAPAFLRQLAVIT